MHNLGNVFRFEVIRTLKKKSFWITALSFPVVGLAVFAIIFFSNQASDKAAEDVKNQTFSIAVTDDSKLISPDLLKTVKASVITDKQTGINDAKSGKLDAYIYYPRDLSKSTVEIYAKNVSLFENGRYETFAKLLLDQTVQAKTTSEIRTIIQGKVGYNTTTYKDGVEYNGLKELVVPGMFLVLFWILISMFGNQMLASTTEEKENRVIEMILTTIQARTLIIGKILSLIVLAGIQMLVILIPTIIAYLLFNHALSLPSFDLSNLPIDPLRIGIGALIFVFSFLLFTGILVGIGAATPTAKEASGFFGVVMVLMFGPLYAATLFVSNPDAAIVKFLSFFPLTAPIPLMLRNAIGNLSVLEAVMGIIILAISAVIALTVSIRLFRYGALEYSRRLSLKSIFTKKTT